MVGDPPIEEPGYIHGVTVVDIGDIRVARGMTRRPTSSCSHRRMNYDAQERRIWCKDCETEIAGYDAFVLLVQSYNGALKSLERREERVSEAEQFALRSLAAKEIDKAWRSRNMLPACPSCKSALFPEDFKDGVKTMIGREYAEAGRRRKERGDG